MNVGRICHGNILFEVNLCFLSGNKLESRNMGIRPFQTQGS